MSTKRKRPSYRLIVLLVFSSIFLYSASRLVDRVMSLADGVEGELTPQSIVRALLPGNASQAIDMMRDTGNLDQLLRQVQANGGDVDPQALAHVANTLADAGMAGVPAAKGQDVEMIDVRNAPMDPEVEAAIRNSGIALHTKGRLEEAINAYQNELKADPKSAATWFNLGVAYYQTQQYQASWDALSKAESLGRRIPPDLKVAVHNRLGAEDDGG